MTQFVESWCVLAWTKILAYYEVPKLRILIVFMAQAPGYICKIKKTKYNFKRKCSKKLKIISKDQYNK
jgi:hypothetical protein